MSDPHEFRLVHDIDLAATPEQVWEAIATGPGIDSWFMGRNQVDPEAGTVASAFPGLDDEPPATITAYEPERRFAYRTPEGEDGTFMAFEYLVEGRDGGSTALRFVHSGILGDGWEEEYDALKKGNPLYLRTLAQYLEHFPGRTAVPVTAFGPQQRDQDQVWAAVTRALGLTKDVHEGDEVRFSLNGLEIRGVVDTLGAPSFLGVRTPDALLRFVGRGGVILTGHHVFADVDPARAQQAWSEWLASVFA